MRDITPEMVEKIVRYVDEDGNGTIDIAELDKAFRLSRWQIEDAIEGEGMPSSKAPRSC